MAEFVQRELYVDTLLSEVLIGYKNPAYIADMLAPMLPVRFRSGIIPQMVQSDWFRNDADFRAPGARSRRGGFRTDNTMTYYVQRGSFGVEVPDEIRDTQMEPYNIDRDATVFAADKVQLQREISFTTTAFTTGKWSQDLVGGTDFTVWSNYGGSTPLTDFTTWNDNIESRIGAEGNVFVVGKQVHNSIRWHPDLIDLIKYTQRGVLTEDLIASLLGIPEYKVGRGIYTTSNEGTAESSVTYTRIWGKNGLVMYRPPAPSIMTPAGIYTVTWQRVVSPLGYMRRWYDMDREVDIFEGNSYFQHKITVPRAGTFLSGIVA